MHVLDLFSGIGGLSLLLPKHTIALYVENDPFCRAVLRARMGDGWLPVAPVHDDITTLTSDNPSFSELEGVDLICAGFPCQDISCIGLRQGVGDGTRSGLFREVVRLTAQLRPKMVLLENVAAFTLRQAIWAPVLSAFSEIGYCIEWTTLGACHVGGWHQRMRFFALCTIRCTQTAPPLLPLTIERLPPSGRIPGWSAVEGSVPQQAPFPNPPAFDPKKGLVDGQVVFRVSRWATPRTGAVAGRKLSQRSVRDLATQLWFAEDTLTRPKRARGVYSNPEWVEWLMGFPSGWTCPSVPLPFDTALLNGSLGCPTTEPKQRLVEYYVGVVARNRALGNACVPQCVALAWDILTRNNSVLSS